jgi:four helix bundle protein
MEVYMDQAELKRRTKAFGLRIIKLIAELPRGIVPDTIGRQLLRSGTSVGANYRAACRARSTADFISKMGIVEEEADESVYWLEMLIEACIIKAKSLDPLLREADELVAIAVASIKTARLRKK